MAGRIPQDFLDQLVNRVDIVELIDSRHPLRKAGRNYVACCPFHNEKTPSFTVSPEKQFYHCFGCNANGTAIGFLMDFDRLEFRDAVEELAQSVGMEIPAESRASSPSADGVDLFGVMSQADQYYRQQLRQHPQRQRAIDYLQSRGLDGETVKRFGIGYAPPGWDNLSTSLTVPNIGGRDLVTAGLLIAKDSGGCYDRFRDRIMFPIRDRRGRVIAFGGRGLDAETTPKYLNSPETPIFHKGRELYGHFEARNANRQLERVLVVEGYMDVVALAQHGISYAVATLGTATSADHIERLFRGSRELVFCYDGDRAGRDAAWRALEQTLPLLRDGRQASFLFLPDGEDPDSLVRSEGADRFAERLDEATPLSDYFFRELAAGVNLQSLDGRARLVETAQPLMQKIPDGAFRQLMLQRVAELAKTTPERLAKASPQAPDDGTGTTAGIRRAARVPFKDTQVRRTLPRYAIALLLARPDLAALAGDTQALRTVAVAGLELLLEMIDLIGQQPHITTAGLVERYRDNAIGTTLQQLALWQPELDHELLEGEFTGAMDRLRMLYVEKQLLDKATRGELSTEERELLRQSARRQELST